jgi:hypothetical protein
MSVTTCLLRALDVRKGSKLVMSGMGAKRALVEVADLNSIVPVSSILRTPLRV